MRKENRERKKERKATCRYLSPSKRGGHEIKRETFQKNETMISKEELKQEDWKNLQQTNKDQSQKP